ncbi:MAG: TonB-linked SusC/RagA family outer membrane protein [Saprospiraceae bacterium]|jgi:TonB-linked SusC/RagA family outer membrane protein
MKINYLSQHWSRKMLTSLLLVAGFICLSSQSFAQSRTIGGTLTDAGDGAPLIGATILVKGTTNGTISDLDGSYSLSADGNATLVISYVGYLTQEIAVSNQSTIDIILSADAQTLEEFVVVGYGTQRKRDVTAAISTVNAEDIQAIPVASSIDAIKGQVSGVDIQSTGGRPGQNPTIKIRGRRSIAASNDPLYVIDGIPQTSSEGEGAIFDINPQDIKSMEILKDAAATAIYGSRGANGVIIISTNRGSAGKTKVTYASFYGATEPTSTVDMMDGQQFANMKRESRREDANGNAAWNGTIPTDFQVFEDAVELESLEQGRTTDYQDLVFGSGWKTNHQLSISGGSEKTQFNFSLGYFGEQGFISNMDFKRYTGRINLDHEISDIFKTGVSFLTTNSVQNWGSNATMGEALANNPLGVPYDEEGNLNFLPTNDGIRTNPLNELVPNAYVDERRSTRIFAPIYLDVNLNSLTEGLSFRTTFGPDIRLRRRGEFRASLTNDNRGGPADAEIENGSDLGFTLENILNYSKPIGSGTFKVTLLQSIQSLRDEFSKAEVLNLPYESQLFYNIGTAEVKGNLSSGLNEWTLASFMGRVNYDIAGKYLFQASLRADGSSRLAEGNKWAYFPGISFGWRIIEEDFMKDNNFFDDLKLRASYGEVGNTSIDPYQTLGGLARTTYAYGNTAAFGFALDEIPNANLGWEVSKTIDIGFDYSVLNGRFNGSIDWYSTKTSDILLERNLPYTSGYQSILQNIGSTASSGVEFNLNAGIISNQSGFSWDIGFNIAATKEKITELALKDAEGNSLDDVGNNWFIGQPINVYYDYEFESIWQSNEIEAAKLADDKVPGEIRLQDQDGDGVITPADRLVLGTDVPNYYGGLRNNFSFGGFDLSTYFYFRQGQMVRSRFHDSNNSLFARYNNLDVDYWTIDNPSTTAPRPNQNQESPRNGSTLTYFDGSYLKLRNVTLGYSLPTSVVEKTPFSNLRFYISGENLWFATGFDTFDPEIDDSGSGDPQVSSSTVPSSKGVIFGLKASF